MAERDEEMKRLKGLRDRLWTHLSTNLPDIYLNGHPTQHLANNLNISISGIKGAALLSQLQPHIALSSGSACSSASPAPSHVIKALGRSDELARATLRFGLGRETTEAEIDQTVAIVTEAIRSGHRI